MHAHAERGNDHGKLLTADMHTRLSREDQCGEGARSRWARSAPKTTQRFVRFSAWVNCDCFAAEREQAPSPQRRLQIKG